MKSTGYEDLRVQKTIKGIYKAFESLIVEKDYQHITVTELARRAEINKKTFYRYYPTLDDLLAELQNRYSEDYLKIIGDYEYPRDLEKSFRAFFEYSNKMGPGMEVKGQDGWFVTAAPKRNTDKFRDWSAERWSLCFKTTCLIFGLRLSSACSAGQFIIF